MNRWMVRNIAVAMLGWSVSAVCGAAAVYVPIPVADRLAKFESTELDIGTPKQVFDGDRTTPIRTPALNPAYVQFELTEPITFECVRIHVAEVSDWSLVAADSLADLHSESESYRRLVSTRETNERGSDQIVFELPVTARAFRFETQRKRGDDYVHIFEIEFCRAGTLDGLVLERVVNRREAEQPSGRTPVDGPIETWEQTVLWLEAGGRVGETDVDVADGVRWTTRGAGITPWGTEPGQFLIDRPGTTSVTAAFGDYAQTVEIRARPRTIANREPDLEVLFIERLPRIDYDGPNGGWPAKGSEVTWRAHVYNWGTRPVPANYTWSIDGTVIGGGEITVAVGPPATESTAIDLPRLWSGEREHLAFEIHPADAAAPEFIDDNNRLAIETDAITVGLWVEQTMWDFHHEHQHRLPTQDANSFAGWAQRLIRQWNQMFREAVYPGEYPDGIVGRVRLDRLVIVPDFALPLHGGLPSNNPDLTDKTIDLQWGVEDVTIRPPDYATPKDYFWSVDKALAAFEAGRVERKQEDPPFWCGLGFIHEMAHARYLVDAYGFNVHSGQGADITQRTLQVTADGQPILGRYMPWENDIQHWRKYKGQMGGDYWSWSVFEAMCWNRVAGQRARGGNCNSPPTIGEFLQDIPETLVYRYVDQSGEPLANAEVCVYRARGTGQGWYTKKYIDEPDIRTMTDGEGRATFDRTLWAADGKIVHTFGHSNSVALVRVTHGGQHYFLFEEVTDANLAYNLGHPDAHEFTRLIRTRTGDPSPDEWNVDDRWEPAGTGFGRRP